MREKYLIFTDLDGTLLDHYTYSFQAASPALTLVKSLDIPLILTSSKTMPEMRQVQLEMEIDHPFIFENGGAICFPGDQFSDISQYSEVDELRVIFLSPQYRTIVSDINRLRQEQSFSFRGFNDMSVKEIMHLTGLKHRQAKLAKRRLCSEPLIWQDSPEKLEIFKTSLRQLGYKLLEGGRFYHVLGETDKGVAAEKIIELYRKVWPQIPVKTIGLGDSPNDIDLLRSVDIPILVKRPDGNYIDISLEKRVIFANGIGPEGWDDAIRNILTLHK